jgi:hypothetical protein
MPLTTLCNDKQPPRDPQPVNPRVVANTIAAFADEGYNPALLARLKPDYLAAESYLTPDLLL